SNSFTGLSQGSYTVVVRDEDGCETTYANNPVIINNTGGPEITEVVATDETCGNADGSITITATGNGALQYSIYGGTTWSTSNSFTGLSQGSYTVVVRDEDGCETTYANNPVIINNTGGPEITEVVATDETCGTADGSITIIATGNGTLEYSIDNGANWFANNVFTYLVAGNYFVVVRDDAACSTTWNNNPVIINNTGGPEITDVVTTDETCGTADGSITITATGNGALQYSIYGGTTWSTSNSFTGLTEGSYTVVVRDEDGCETTYANNPVIINNTGGPEITEVVATDETCGTADGSITITASGNGALQYSIYGGTTWSTSNSFTGLSQGSYTVVVRDEDGCETTYASNPVVLSGTPGIDQIVAETVNAVNGQDNGSVTILVNGGTPSFEYKVDNLEWQSGETFDGLTIGSHIAYVLDANGCEAQIDFIIFNQIVGEVVLSAEVMEQCLNLDITLPVDAENFAEVVSFTIVLIFNSDLLSYNYLVNKNPILDAAGTFTTSLNGNTLTIRYSASTSSVTIPNGSGLFEIQFSGLAAGYSSIEWNFDECVIISPDGYEIPKQLVPGAINILPAPDINWSAGGTFCAGDSTQFTISSNDTQTLNYQWSGPSITYGPDHSLIFEPLQLTDNGTYTLVVSNIEGCSIDEEFELQVNPSPQISISETETLCAGTLHDLDAGPGFEYEYLWQDGSNFQTYQAIDSGTYSVKVSNIYGCEAISSVKLIPCLLEMVLPNAFTPNGDDLNNTFNPIITGDIVPTRFLMKVYNRWGELIYMTTEYNTGWDGNYNGAEAPPGTYSYTIIFEIPDYVQAIADSPIKGVVTLIR
ncbi:MAG: gliding motility-associated C-terminal domain-containing protein, partial [Lentimicrobium sp.]|nr:gliding motility-associated C-terminal domain-containing protein [Lentimicrobium sp.]